MSSGTPPRNRRRRQHLPAVLTVAAATAVTLAAFFLLRNLEGDELRTESWRAGLIVAVLLSGSVVGYSMRRGGRPAQEEPGEDPEGHFKSLFENAVMGLYRTTPDGKILLANPALLRMLGFSSLAELIQRNLEDRGYAPRYSRAKFKQRLESEGQLLGLEAVWTKRDGTSLFVRENARVIYDETGKALYYEGTIEDVSERKRAEEELARHREQLEELVAARTAELRRTADKLRATNLDLERASEAAQAADRAKSEFLARMSHEIRTPLNSIVGFTEMLLDDELTAAQRDALETTLHSAELLERIIDEILDLSRIEAGRVELEEIRFRPRALVSDLGELIRIRAQGRPIVIRLEVRELPEEVVGDPTRVGQVLLNLLSNAVKFTERGEVVAIVRQVAEEEDRIRLELVVRDTGIGIPEEKLGHVFDAFSQADSSISRKHGGTGLGLTISRRLARLMGGDLTVESRVGEGSTFRCDLWLRRAAAAEASDRPSERRREPDRRVLPAADGGLRILLAEDNPANQKMARAMLEGVGIEVEVAHNGAQAAAMASAGGYHLVLMDLHMPEMGGLEATRILRRKGIETPIVAMTADAMKGDRERCLAAGMDDHIAKPVRREAVLELIRRHCGIDPGKKPGAVRRVLLVDRDEDQLRAMHDMLRTLLPNAAYRTTTNGVRAAAMLSSFAPDLVVLDLTVPQVDGRALLGFVRSEHRHAHTRVVVTTESGETGLVPEVGRTEILPQPLDCEALLSAVKRLLAPAQAAAATSPELAPGMAAALGLSPKLYEEVLALFVEDTTRRVEVLIGALARGDAATISAEAHALKGGALSLRQEALAAAAEGLETKARDGDLAGVEGDLETLQHAFDRVRASVDALDSQ